MAVEDVRMLRSAILLERFTLRELAIHAGVSRNTAASWWKRNRPSLDLVSSIPLAPGRGRPSKTWQVTANGAAALKRKLAALALPTDAQPAPSDSGHLDRIELLIGQARRAAQNGDIEANEQALAAARLRIRLAWQRFAQVDAVGYQLPLAQMQGLVDMEREVGAGAIWGNSTLPEVAVWLAERLQSMHRAGIALRFAGRVLSMRAAARGRAQSIRLTAAACAAQVWADEGLGAHCGLSRDDLRACAAALTDVPASKPSAEHLMHHTEDLLVLLNPDNQIAFGVDVEQREAALLGLATLQRRWSSPVVANWLLALQNKVGWSDELAPAVVFGTIEAPHVNAREIYTQVGASLERALAAAPKAAAHPGSVRATAHNLCRSLMDYYPERKEMDTGTVDIQFVVASYAKRQEFTRRI